MIDLQTEVRSNISSLSALALHEALVRMVDGIMRQGAEFLRGIVPKESGEMAAHVGSKEAVEIAGIIEARLGIPAIGESVRPGEGGSYGLFPSDRSHYPLFTDQGTGIFGPTHSPIFARHAGPMVFEDGGHTIFAHSVKGQPGQHFMAETLAYCEALLRSDQTIHKALKEMAARARVERLA